MHHLLSCAALRAFEAYARNVGVQFEGTLSDEFDEGVGLRATGWIESQQIIASVPLRACVTGEDELEVAAKLARAPRSPWLDLVYRESNDLPLLWDDSTFEAATRGLSVRYPLAREREAVRVAGVDPLAHALVTSRAYWTNDDCLVLAPLLDMVNHRDKNAASVDVGDGVFARKNELVLVAETATPPGAQIFSTYMPNATNAETFVSFGFVQELKSDVAVEIEVGGRRCALRVHGDEVVDDLLDELPSLPLRKLPGCFKHRDQARAFFRARLDDVPQPDDLLEGVLHDDDDDDDGDDRGRRRRLGAMIATLRREERAALSAVEAHVLRAIYS